MTAARKQKHDLSMTVEEALRFLFTQNAEWIAVDTGKNAKFFNIRQVVVFLEKGMGSLALQEILDSMPIKSRKVDEADLQTTDGDARMVSLDEEGTWIGTVREYRKKRLGVSWGYGQLQIEGTDRNAHSQREGLSLRSQSVERETFRALVDSEEVKERLDLPKWWCAPLPLLYFDGRNVILNDCGEGFLRADKKVLAEYLCEEDPADRDGSYLFEVPSRDARTIYSLRPLVEAIYHIEDVSGDYRTARDLLWWASVGKTLVAQIEQSGASVRRAALPPEKHEESEQVFPCAWDGDLQGYIVISVETAEEESIEEKTLPQEMPRQALAEESEQPSATMGAMVPLEPVEPEKYEQLPQTVKPEKIVKPVKPAKEKKRLAVAIREESLRSKNEARDARKVQKVQKEQKKEKAVKAVPETATSKATQEPKKEIKEKKEVKKTKTKDAKKETVQEAIKKETKKAPAAKEPKTRKMSEVLPQSLQTEETASVENDPKPGKKPPSRVASAKTPKKGVPEKSAQTLLPVPEEFRPASLRDALTRSVPAQREVPAPIEPVEPKPEGSKPSRKQATSPKATVSERPKKQTERKPPKVSAVMEELASNVASEPPVVSKPVPKRRASKKKGV